MGEYRTIEPGVWKPENDGDFIEGVLINKIPENKPNKMSAKYRLETKQGAFMFWGCATLDERMDFVSVGDIIKVTYCGQKDLEKCRKLNLYKVERYENGDSDKNNSNTRQQAQTQEETVEGGSAPSSSSSIEEPEILLTK